MRPPEVKMDAAPLVCVRSRPVYFSVNLRKGRNKTRLRGSSRRRVGPSSLAVSLTIADGHKSRTPQILSFGSQERKGDAKNQRKNENAAIPNLDLVRVISKVCGKPQNCALFASCKPHSSERLPLILTLEMVYSCYLRVPLIYAVARLYR